MELNRDLDFQIALIRRGAELIIDESELRARLEKSINTRESLIVKLGADPTAPDLHLGHTVILRKLKHFQDLGHQATFLIGDFTGRIGDPTGRDQTRPQLSEREVKRNATTYQQQIGKLLDLDSLKLVFNSDWLKNMTLEDVVRLTSLATMARLLEHNTFRDRFEHAESIRFNEMLYPFMQAYDSVALRADVELGGTDQTFNLVFGRDIQRAFGQTPQICLTMPILVGTDGKQKMSKSLGNYIGIDEPPYIMFEKLMRMVDSNIVQYFTLLTDKPVDEIRSIERELENNPSTEFILQQKAELASLIVESFHGEEAAHRAGSSYGKEKKEGIHQVTIPASEMPNGRNIPVVRLLVIAGGASSKTEARRMIQQGAVYINNSRIESFNQEIDLEGEQLLRIGKSYIAKLSVK